MNTLRQWDASNGIGGDFQGGDILSSKDTKHNRLRGERQDARLRGHQGQLQGQSVIMAMAAADLSGPASPLWTRYGPAAQGQRGAGALSYVVMGLVCSALLVVGMRARKASRRGTVAVAVPHGYVELSAMDTTGA